MNIDGRTLGRLRDAMAAAIVVAVDDPNGWNIAARRAAEALGLNVTRIEFHRDIRSTCFAVVSEAAKQSRTEDQIASAIERWRASNGLPADPPRPAPTLERVEFTAERDQGWWLIGVHDVGVFRVLPGDERCTMTTGPVIRIKWGESMSPKPIEVWLERPAASPAPPGMSDAEVAAEFFRRFRPERVLLGTRGFLLSFAESSLDGWTSGLCASRPEPEDHPAGDPGFVAAVLRARELVRKGGG